MIKDFVKKALEREYLGKTIYNFNHSLTFIVNRVRVEDGGVDPQWEIELYGSGGSPESFSMCFPNDKLPEIVESSPELCKHNIPIDEICDECAEDMGLKSCEQCDELAWDGYICHACGMKEI